MWERLKRAVVLLLLGLALLQAPVGCLVGFFVFDCNSDFDCGVDEFCDFDGFCSSFFLCASDFDCAVDEFCDFDGFCVLF